MNDTFIYELTKIKKSLKIKISLSDETVHGLLTAVACCPEEPYYLDWMSILMNNLDNIAETSHEQKRILQLLLEKVRSNLDNEIFSIYLNKNNKKQFSKKYFENWAKGFSLGFSISFFCWTKLSNPKIESLTMAIVILGENSKFHRKFFSRILRDKNIDPNQFYENTMKLLNNYVQEIYNFFHKGIVSIPENSFFISESYSWLYNLEQPCNCGSGKPYKMCCLIVN
ncbi:MAG: UPF0149 family protein [Legionellales bacterium]|nr:UPF0149 family protein [Legionellales bacterium]